MIRVIVAFTAGVGVIATLLSVYFRSSATHLTQLPRQVAAIVKGALPSPPAHVVVVVEENKDYTQIVGNTTGAPYLNSLIARGALFTQSFAVAHPSQPNYFALFSGVTDKNGDGCPPTGVDPNAQNLATELRTVGRSFAGYSEDLPRAGFRGCRSGEYARKHAPWAVFDNVPADENLPLSAMPAYDRLPTVSFIIPNLLDDMHSASISRGDAWLQRHIEPLIAWAQKHNTLVIVTWDENNGIPGNRIPTIFVGPMVHPGRYNEPITHYRLLRTIEQFYGTKYSGEAANAGAITGMWSMVDKNHQSRL